MYIMFYFNRYKCIYVNTQGASTCTTSTCTGNFISQYIQINIVYLPFNILQNYICIIQKNIKVLGFIVVSSI